MKNEKALNVCPVCGAAELCQVQKVPTYWRLDDKGLPADSAGPANDWDCTEDDVLGVECLACHAVWDYDDNLNGELTKENRDDVAA